ncbi:pyridoxal phosphate-dependent transferase [Ilyonectria sp. MPI-CAGE-AT-0026]|nr:pyridoxal phosphate-dependent transferase [Ilyonectria sp. MPI-CAGE-AT-0026]
MISKISPPLEHINLQGGWPTPNLHPSKAMGAAALAVFRQKDIDMQLRYGPECGSGSFRENIGKWLTEMYAPAAGAVAAERIIITNGASNGLATVLQKFADPKYTRAVWMVEPTYFLACPIFRDAGLAGKIYGVPEGDDGVDLEFLRNALQEADDKSDPSLTPSKTPEGGYDKVYRHIIYMIPTFSNPSGKTMTLDSRRELIRLARLHDALVVSDDVYDMLRWPTAEDASLDSAFPCPPRLVDVDREMEGASAFGNSVSNGSFSKIVAPGVRVGWLEATPAFISAMGTVGATVSGGCQGHLASLIVEKLLADGVLASHIKDTLIPTYQKRWYSMTRAIKEFLYPLGVRIISDGDDKVAGGFFLYISFAGCTSPGSKIAEVALEEFNLKIAPGAIFSVPDDPSSKERGDASYGNGARLCWAWNEEEALVDGIKRLGETISQAGRSA